MQDRVPLYPGRVTMTPVAGQANTFDMVRADDPTQEGTPLNKATLLKDATAALYGLGTRAVPDDVLAELGKYKQNWWKRRTNGSLWHPVYGAASTVTVCASEDELMVKFRYADEIEISDSGVVSLKNPVEVNSPYSNYTELNQHKFFQTGVYPGQDYNSNVYYVPEGAADATRNYSDRTYYVYKTAGVVTSEYSQSIGDWEYVQSSNRSAYPDSGTQDGYEYEYLGIPFDNAVTAPKIEEGSYVGTGTYGSANPNTLTFGFVPKVVVFWGYAYSDSGGRKFRSLINESSWQAVVVMDELTGNFQQGMPPYMASSFPSPQAYTKKGNGGTSLTWYNTNAASFQFNANTNTYYYMAIG